MKVTIGRTEHFNAAHRLYHPEWTDQQNVAVFGPCSNPHYHGHNYVLTVRLTGQPHPDTGYVYDLKDLSALIKREILDTFDHRNLNLDTEDFRQLNPTAENIAVVCWNRLRPHLAPELALSVTLHETDRNVAEYHG
ncbi:6-pyruvoyl trahydropterin synthase family protein [Hymenobacter sp. B81]|uniref:6-pyruvoyl trahydropterin synthase family protein n=1 Tax=Hymenobacter sp. B81 TaxID=3344878 RepID=UPI0037DC8F69